MIVFAACEKYIFNHANYLFISFLLYIKQGVISALWINRVIRRTVLV